MRRFGWLMPKIASRSNLTIALHKAATGAKKTAEVRQFSANADENLNELLSQLLTLEWHPRPYHRFVVHDPKQRVIHAAPFSDRVVHHAVMNVAGPYFERGAINTSFACRKGRGNRAGVTRARDWTRHFACFLKLDVRRYFDSIRHDVLVELFRRRFKDAALLTILERIVESFQITPGRGIPIGTLTSQYFANFYLDGLDHWIREILGCSNSVRYMDDIVLWHNDPKVLFGWLRRITLWLESERGLRLKGDPKPASCRDGLPFLGYRITPRGILLSRTARKRFSRRLTKYEKDFHSGAMTESTRQRRVDSLLAFTDVAHCRSWRQTCLVRIERDLRPYTMCPDSPRSDEAH